MGKKRRNTGGNHVPAQQKEGQGQGQQEGRVLTQAVEAHRPLTTTHAPYPETWYVCGRCSSVKKIAALFVPDILVCAKCGQICRANVKDVR